jgi:hypothetical protein
MDRKPCLDPYCLPVCLRAALTADNQIHATLALAAAIGLSADLPVLDAAAWRDVAAAGAAEAAGMPGCRPGEKQGALAPYRPGRHE